MEGVAAGQLPHGSGCHISKANGAAPSLGGDEMGKSPRETQGKTQGKTQKLHESHGKMMENHGEKIMGKYN